MLTLKGAHTLHPLFMQKKREFIMGNNNLTEKLTAEINNARKAYSEIKTLNKDLSKFATNQNKINMRRGASNSKLLKNLYWWVIDLENEVDIYGIKSVSYTHLTLPTICSV